MSGLLDQFCSSRMATSSPSSGRVVLPPDQEITLKTGDDEITVPVSASGETLSTLRANHPE